VWRKFPRIYSLATNLTSPKLSITHCTQFLPFSLDQIAQLATECNIHTTVSINLTIYAPRINPEWASTMASNVGDFKLASTAAGFTLGFGILCVWNAIQQTRSVRSSLRSVYIYMT
jgi:hypothetical protein